MNTQKMVEKYRREIPKELQQENQWLLFRAQFEGQRIKKYPFTRFGKRVEIDDLGKSVTYNSFEHCLKELGKGGYDGLGFGFLGKKYVGIDIDYKPYGNGASFNVLGAVLCSSMNSYTETSVGGGKHVIVRAELVKNLFSNDKDKGISLFWENCFFALTADRLADFPARIAYRHRQIEQLYEVVERFGHDGDYDGCPWCDCDDGDCDC